MDTFFGTKRGQGEMREQNDAAESRSITDDCFDRFSFNHAKSGNFIKKKLQNEGNANGMQIPTYGRSRVETVFSKWHMIRLCVTPG